ncbi:MAG TPA: prolyl oligopeptidase family serine peptidase [Marmoricola sp.]|nr:prolyl oligopeptidase family serine peptidase [Marmoricola sp.]
MDEERPIPWGAWPSPLTADALAAGSVGLSDPDIVDGEVWWCESRPSEEGRIALVRELQDGSVEDVLTAPWSVGTRVHEYGGNAWVVVPGPDGPTVVFAHAADQRLYALRPGAQVPEAITPEPAEPRADRYADFTVAFDPPHVICVRERHSAGTIRRTIVAVPVDPGEVRELVGGSDFLAAPRVSPDGRRLAWIAWDHPSLPWDATELRAGLIGEDGAVGRDTVLLGGPSESVLQPEWLSPTELVVLSDRSGWWNVHRVGTDGTTSALCPKEAEFAGAMWTIGSRWFAPVDDGRLLVRYGVGDARLALLDPATGALEDVDAPFRVFGPNVANSSGSLRARGSSAVLVAGGPDVPTAVVELDLGTGRWRVVRAAGAELDAAVIPEAHVTTFAAEQGPLHAVVHPPRLAGTARPQDSGAPYVVRVHGGPTAQARTDLDPWVAFFTSRGIGVADLDHRGSTGYGRVYRQSLEGGWGVVDVEDADATARALVADWGADPDRLVIMGKSAGGATVLGAVTTTGTFAAGISEFGIGDYVTLARDTHDFESRYLDWLMAPYPEGAEVYATRSPVNHVDSLQAPVLLLQGSEDPVVPPNQARAFADAARARGLPHALVVFEGEGHGWSRAETIVAAAEAMLSFLGQVLGFRPPGVPELPLR